MHLPLLAPGGGLSRLRVGSETREAVAGRALVFDDSFEHEAWNDSDDVNVNDDDEDEDEDNDKHEEDVNCPNNSGKNRSDTGRETSTSEGVSGRRDAEPRPQGRREAERGKGYRSPDDEGRKRREARAKSGRSKAAPRVNLIADIWHPDLSNR